MRTFLRSSLLSLLILAPACKDSIAPSRLAVPVTPRFALTPDIVVTNLSDAGTGSLRAALAAATDGKVIGFDASIAGGTITVSSTLNVATSVTIEGSETDGITISGGGTVLVMQIASSKSVTLRNLTVTGGQGGTSSPGGILNGGTLTIEHSTVSGNQAEMSGGIGGGTVIVRNSTVSDNAAKFWPGINATSVTVEHGTVYGNTSLPCPECDPFLPEPNGVAIIAENLTLKNSIVEDCFSTLSFSVTGVNFSAGYWDCSSLNGDLKLGSLADNGGPTRTRALNTGSVAIDAVSSCTLATDQRHVIRPQGSACDVGAYEVDVYVAVTLSVSDKGTVDPATGELTITGSLSCSSPVTIELAADASQDLRIKRVPVHVVASGAATIPCDAPEAWSMTLMPDNSAFTNSDIAVSVSATGTGGVAPASASTVVRAAWKRRR